MPWTDTDIPDQSGKVAIVTGANSGIGFATAKALAHAGAQVTLACRSLAKGEAAVDSIRAEQTSAQASGRVSCQLLDLADLGSVQEFAAEFAANNSRLDLLVNNAGVMATPLSKTVQGFEGQFAVNHLGHFALTARLMSLLLQSTNGRVVSVSSVVHRIGKLDLDDLHFAKRRYSPWQAYGQSKLANLLFTLELQHRFEKRNLSLKALASHPGWTATNLQHDFTLGRLFNPLLAMKTPEGALSILRACCDSEVCGGEYFGPRGIFELRGSPTPAFRSAAATNRQDAARLWAASEQMTGVTFTELTNK